jgi:hypothetical protein
VIDKKFIHNAVMHYHLNTFELQPEGDDEEEQPEVEFEELETYFRLYVIPHLGKSALNKVFTKLQTLFSAKNIYKQILYHKSYTRYRQKIQALAESKELERDEKTQLHQFNTILCLVEQTIKAEPNNFTDFCT